MSFETDTKPTRRLGGPGRTVRAPGRTNPNGPSCDLCGSQGHVPWQCNMPLDGKFPTEGPIGTIEASRSAKRGPAAPIEEYKGPGRVLVLPGGVFGDDLAGQKLAAGESQFTRGGIKFGRRRVQGDR